jgi:hypothetical protein
MRKCFYILSPFGILYGDLGYFWPFGTFCTHLVHFSGFGIMYQEKSGNSGCSCKFKSRRIGSCCGLSIAEKCSRVDVEKSFSELSDFRGVDTYLLLLFVEVVDDDSDEEVEGEEGAEDDEEDEVEVHVDVHLAYWLLAHLAR